MTRKPSRLVFIKIILPMAALITLTSFSGNEKVNDKECSGMIKAFYHKMKDVNEVSSAGKVHYMNYKITSAKRVLKGTDSVAVSVSNAEVTVGKLMSTYVSDEVSYFIDNKTAVTLLPSRKTIYIADSNKDINKEKRRNDFVFLQDSLFSMLKEISCQDVTGANGKKVVEVVFKPEQRLVSVHGMREIRFYALKETGEVKRAKIDYDLNAEYKWIDYEFLDIALNKPGETDSKSVYAMFMKSDTKLIDKYRDYKMIDVRKRTGKTK